MRSNVQVVGHPLHPLLVTVAIGAFVSAFIFDIAAVVTGGPSWFEMSYWTLMIGVISGAIAAVAGLYDYLTLRMSANAKKAASTHFLLNVGFMILFIVSLASKGQYAAVAPEFVPYGKILSTFAIDLVGIALLLVSGWFGGEIVYRHGVAVLEEAASELRPRPATGTTPVMGSLGGERPGDKEDPEKD